MKQFIPLAVVGLLFTANVMAQDSTSVKGHKKGEYHQSKDGKKHGHHTGDKGLAGVQLTDDQKAQAKTIHEDFKKKADAIKAQNLSAEEQKKQMTALHRERKEKVQGLLTTEQKAKVAENRKKGVEKAKATSAARLDKMKTDLNLKDEQVAQIKAQQAKTHEQMKAIRDNKSLTEEAKKEQVKALMQQQKENWKSILTPEQQAKLKNRHKTREAK